MNFIIVLNMDKNVWIDLNNPIGVLLKYDGKIITKVTRLSWENKEQLKTSPYSLFIIINNIFGLKHWK